MNGDFCATCGGLEGVDAHGKGGHPYLQPGRNPRCEWCRGSGTYESHHNGDLQRCLCRPPPKDPCPWTPTRERAECRCDHCQIDHLHRVLDAARGVRYKTKALREALAAYASRFGR